MRRTWITLILIGLFLLEGTVMPWLLPASWQSEALVAPRFVFVVILYVALYSSRPLALAYGLIFGLLHDFVYYGPMIGTYSFSMGLSAYLVGLAFHRGQIRLLSSLCYICIGNFLLECVLFGLYRLFELNSLTFRWALVHQILPGMLINLLFALAVYLPIRKLLEKMDAEAESRDESFG
jgi:rod shape-determining protein MreD